MNDLEFKARCRMIERLRDKWEHLIPAECKLKIEYEREPKAEDTDSEVYMEIATNWAYCWADITVYVPTIGKLSSDEVEEWFVHELMHIFLNPLDEKGKHEDQVEMMATMLARRFVQTAKEKMS